MVTTSKIDLHKLSKFANKALPAVTVLCFIGGTWVSFYLHFLTVIFIYLSVINFFYRHVQTKHTILRNFGLLGQARYMIESIGPEMRQYLFANDREERPFNRTERSEVYSKAKGEDDTMSFGSQNEFDAREIKIRHSMYPVGHDDVKPYKVTFGEERGIAKTYTFTKPYAVSAMSYGALGANAVRALSKGSKMAGIALNTGEGGFPKYHLMEGADLIFQIGTAKFGVRNDDGSLNDDKLRELCTNEAIKMIEIKLSQGAKPGKGGILPKEKITKEISELRGVPQGKDVISPPHHIECKDKETTVAFIAHVQEVSQLPVGIKLCLGCIKEFRELVHEMISQDTFPDFISIDGAEGGTGAAPKAFLDGFGMPLMPSLHIVNSILIELDVRDRTKIIAAGKLVNPGRQLIAMALGADAIYSARGFMLAMGCIQALLCGNNKCPAGITTHDPELQRGLEVGAKALRVQNYVKGLEKDYYHMLAAAGKTDYRELTVDDLFVPHDCALADYLAENQNISQLSA